MAHIQNSDYPDDENVATEPLSFPRALENPCIRVSVRVYVPSLNETRIVHEVLILEEQNNLDNEMQDKDDMQDQRSTEDEGPDYAYWLQRPLIEAIYGQVRVATVLKRRRIPPGADGEEAYAEWEVTEDRCAVKEMSWHAIRTIGHRLREDPISEMRAMQFISRCLLPQEGETDPVIFQRVMEENHVLLPIEVLNDGDYLYSIMPYCNGGELFNMLDDRNRFSEPEARYWLKQILRGIQTLQNLGICHRDMSLENVLIHEDCCFIMDFGMCCRIPYTNIPGDSTDFYPPETRGERLLIQPGGTMGKWVYMSPEIARNQEFDGHSVDLWAVGVMLFTMVTGFNPWARPDNTDVRFHHMTDGRMVEILTDWDLGLTPAVMDLLQRMLWAHPRNRLSLEQVNSHPWMQGAVERPVPRPPWA